MKKQKKISSFDELPRNVQKLIREDAFQLGVTPELMFQFLGTHSKEEVKSIVQYILLGIVIVALILLLIRFILKRKNSSKDEI